MEYDMKKLNKIRIITIEGKDWLVGKDVVEILGYNCDNVSYSKYIKKHCDEEDYILMRKTEMDFFKMVDVGRKGEYLINESGLYNLIYYSSNTSVMKKEKIIKWFKEIGFIDDSVVFRSRKEINFLDKLENALIPFNIKGVRQYNVLNYRIDYYIPSLNVAIEYDENGHKDYTYEAHELRQELIEKELGCRFIRVTDEKNDEFNIGLVIKELFNIK